MGKTIQANRLIDTKNLSHVSWLEQRKQGLGGSDVAVAAGVSPFCGSWELWLEKTGRKEREFDAQAKERMAFGNILEPVIAQVFADKNPQFKIEKRNCIFQHPTTKWALCNVDRVIYDTNKKSWGVLECKNVGEWAYRLGDWDDDQIPFYYMCQLQHMLYVLDLDWGYFGYFIGGNRFGQQYVERDDELIADLEKSCANFWNLVESGVEPTVDALSASALSEMYPPREESPAVDLSLDVDVIKALKKAQDTFSEAKLALDQQKNEVKRLLEGAQIGLLGDHKVVTWKEQVSNRLDTSRLKKEMPDIASQYNKPSTSRVFKTNWKGLEI